MVLVVVTKEEIEIIAGGRIYRRLNRTISGITDRPGREPGTLISIIKSGKFTGTAQIGAAGYIVINIIPCGIHFQLHAGFQTVINNRCYQRRILELHPIC